MESANAQRALDGRLAKFREVARTRFRKRQQEFVDEERKTGGQVSDSNLSPLGRAARRLERLEHRLAREFKERCVIQREVASEYNCPEMLSKVELDEMEESTMTSAQHAVLALQQCNSNDFHAVGGVSPASINAAQEWAQFHLPTQIRSVINTELDVLRAEGEAYQTAQSPPSWKAESRLDSPLEYGKAETLAYTRENEIARAQQAARTERAPSNTNSAPTADMTAQTAPSPDEPASSRRPQLDVKAERRAKVDSYLDEVFQKTGKRIPRAEIWRAARYKTRTEFERWERNDPRATKAADERCTRILIEKPHLKQTEGRPR